MPLTAWICKGCGGRTVPLDHFATTKCGETVCHPDYAAALLADRNAQPSGVVRVTHGLGCPRKAAIEQHEDYAADPLEFNASLTGVAWHARMESGASEGAEIAVHGVIDGVNVAGKVDRLRVIDGEIVVEDWKHKSDFGLRYIKDEPEMEHKVQVSVYSHMANAARAIIWYHGSANGALYPKPAKTLPLDEALAHKPYNCNYTVRELYHQADDWVSGRVHWRELPLAGNSIKFGSKTACDYCPVREECTVGAMGSPF